MAKRILVFFITAVLLCLFSVALVSAESISKNGATLDFPDGFTVLYKENLSKNTEVVKLLGHSVQSLKKEMDQSGIVAIAVDEGNTEQFVYKCVISEFSEQTESFNSFNDEALAKINTEMFGGNAKIQRINEIVYFYTKSFTESAEFYTYQYVTVQNGRLYSFIYYGNDATRISTLIETAKLEIEGEDKSYTQIGPIILMSVVMVAAIVAMVLIAISVIRDITNDKRAEENDVAEYIRIKRRRF